MTDFKSISLVITMLISLLTFGQKNDTIKYCLGCPKDRKALLIIVDDLRVNKNVAIKIGSENIKSIKILKYEEAKLQYSDCGLVGAMIIETKNLNRNQKIYLKKQAEIETQIQKY